MSSRAIFTAAEQGDELAKKIVDETAYYLAVGAMNLMHIIDPDVVVFAGGMTAAGEPFLGTHPALRSPTGLSGAARPSTLIRYAQLGNDAGFIGSAACAKYLVEGKL